MKPIIKTILFRCLAIFMGLTSFLFVAEIVLRFLPVTDSFHSLSVNEENPVFRCEPNRVVRWTRSWDFSLSNVVRYNNYGFASDIDYMPEENKPLLSIVGDSFVEATTVSWEQSIKGRLQKHAGDQIRVYAFGKSGSPMSQYLVYAEFAKDNFQPDAMIIPIIHNDFDESLYEYNKRPGFHYFIENDNKELILRRVDLEVSLIKKLVRRSALGMYLFVHLEIQHINRRVKYLLDKEEYLAHAMKTTDSVRVAKSRRVVDTFLQELSGRAGLDPSKILFVVDGLRSRLYLEEELNLGQHRFFDIMRRYFMKRAAVYGYEAIDMEPVFVEHHQRHGQKFESYPKDNHWNSLGHQLVTEAIVQSKLFHRFTNGSDPDSLIQKCRGRLPEHIMSHPVISDKQHYFDVYRDGKWRAQIIVIYDEGVTSPADKNRQIELSGKIEKIDMGGEPGTRGSYRGEVMYVARWRYLD